MAGHEIKWINAGALPLSATFVRAAQSYCLDKWRMLPAKAVMHPAQEMAALNQGSASMEATGPYSLCGTPISVDIREPYDRVQFKDADDMVLAEIICLAVPCGFEK